MTRLKNKVAVITGGSGGIGLAGIAPVVFIWSTVV